MTQPSPAVSTPVLPHAIRVFCGYKRPQLSREQFFAELGSTFMPGTPAMLSPLGLAAYLPAVLDLNQATLKALPDEVALIVYASMEAYERRNTLLGRMYTHAHAGVFDMERSRSQFPGPASNPTASDALGRRTWVMRGEPVDWQAGSTRVLVLARESQGILEGLMASSELLKATFLAPDVDEIIVTASAEYGVLWIHGAAPESLSLSDAPWLPKGAQIVRNLVSEPVRMTNGVEGPTITGSAAYCFRFVRDLHHFL